MPNAEVALREGKPREGREGKGPKWLNPIIAEPFQFIMSLAAVAISARRASTKENNRSDFLPRRGSDPAGEAGDGSLRTATGDEVSPRLYLSHSLCILSDSMCRGDVHVS